MIEHIHPVQLEGLRRMTPQRKIEMLCNLYDAGITLRVAGLKRMHPTMLTEELEFVARRALRHAGT